MESVFSKSTLVYHNIFDYPLTSRELDKWKCKKSITGITGKTSIKNKNNFYFLEGRENIIKKRLQNEKYSIDKLKTAKKVAKLIGKIPSVLFVGVTGSLAMANSKKDSDIDLMIITKQDTLWLTRLIVYFVLSSMHFVLRRPLVKNERDALCLNMWLDETNLIWDKKDRNLYTAHEIAQIVPLVNKNRTYEKFLYLNRWILDYWPKAVIIQNVDLENTNYESKITSSKFLEKIAFKVQHIYMKKKMTREVVSPTRAIFHPIDWGNKILSMFSYTNNSTRGK